MSSFIYLSFTCLNVKHISKFSQHWIKKGALLSTCTKHNIYRKRNWENFLALGCSRIHTRSTALCSANNAADISRKSDSYKTRWFLGSDNNPTADPSSLVQNDLSKLHGNICQELLSENKKLQHIVQFHFNGLGKAFRPTVVLLMSHCINEHRGIVDSCILNGQRTIAMISEMIHVASLIHDDVVDIAELRRGQPSVQKAFGQRKAVLAGDYIISVASSIIARLQNIQVIEILSQVLEDLVKGEFMQLGTRGEEEQRFNHYMKKNYRKTGSLIANSCKAVAVLSQSNEHLAEHNDLADIAYNYGRNLGVAFQLVDDLLDFTSTESLLGKPAIADLKLGLATAPVLFAAEEFSELNPMIMRRFSQPGDVNRAFELVRKSDGLSKTRFQAEQHVKEAVRLIKELLPSPYQDALVSLAHHVLTRTK